MPSGRSERMVSILRPQSVPYGLEFFWRYFLFEFDRNYRQAGPRLAGDGFQFGQFLRDFFDLAGDQGFDSLGTSAGEARYHRGDADRVRGHTVAWHRLIASQAQQQDDEQDHDGDAVIFLGQFG